MTKLDAPCRKCEERELGCHSKCEKYQDYNSQLEIVRQQRAEAVDRYYTATCSTRTKKRFDKQGKGRY